MILHPFLSKFIELQVLSLAALLMKVNATITAFSNGRIRDDSFLFSANIFEDFLSYHRGAERGKNLT